MAQRRMFAKSIVLSDAFLDMSMGARCLYFTLGMLADDDGVVGNPKAIMRQCGASQDDMMALLQKRYVLAFESGVVVIKHWRINNYLRNDRYQRTTYVEELETLETDQKGAYTEKNGHGIPVAYQVTTDGIPSIGKDRISKDNNILSDKSDDTHSAIVDIIAYLNHVVGTKYTVRCKSTNEKITARLREGHTVDDFKTVIDKKYAQWGNDPKMAQYLRPETLFSAAHFESYLNEVVTKVGKKKTNTFEDFNQRQYDYDELLKDIGGQSV